LIFIFSENITIAMTTSDWPVFPCSLKAKLTLNKIRETVETLKPPVNHPKNFLALSLGDPTTKGNLPPPDLFTSTLHELIAKGHNNGYTHSAGTVEARSAVAEKFSHPEANAVLTPDDVILTSGCGHAIEIAITGTLNRGDGILIPAPGFSLYVAIAEAYEIIPQHYRLDPEKSWEADMEDLEKKCDSTTRALLITNPSNPCGSVYTKEHLKALADFATRHKLIVIADEIYANMSFDREVPFISLAEADHSLPVISVGGISKQYLVPGWRVGWLTVYNRHEALTTLKAGFHRLITLLLAPNSLVQAALPTVLESTPQEFYDGLLDVLRNNATTLYAALVNVPGLKPIMPRGAMYMMVGIDPEVLDYDCDIKFSRALLQEQNIMVLPGQVFNVHGYFRLVITLPSKDLLEAAERLKQFCAAHPRRVEPPAKRLCQEG
jgi:tyrosine aminotransferase